MRRTALWSSLLLLGWGTLAVAEVRTWSDKSGKFKIEAEFIEMKDGKVALKKSDGKRVEIPLEKLSDEDKKVAEELSAENPFAEAPANEPASPFEDVGGGVGGPALAKNTGLPPQGKKKGDAWMAPDFAKLRKVAGLKKTDKNSWQLPAIPVVAVELAESVSMPKLGFHERISGSSVSPNGEWMGISTNDAFEGGRVVLLNLKAGEVAASYEFPKPQGKDQKPVIRAVSPDGQWVLTGFDHNAWDRVGAMRVTLWKVEGDALQPAVIWSPFETGSKEWHEQDKSRVTWAGFVDAKTLLLQASGFLVKWDLTTGKPTYQVGLESNSIQFIGDGTKILVASHQALGVVDVALGKILFYKNINASGSVDVSPDGKRILVHTGDNIDILDATTGDTTKSIKVEQFGKSFWAGNDHILAGEHGLLDVENEFVCWNYNGQSSTFRAGGKLWFLMGGTLRSENLPHAEALEKIKEAERDPSFFVLKPGGEVSIEVQIAEESEAIKNGLIARLEAAGFKYNPSSPLKFVCSKRVEKSEEVSVSEFGGFPRGGEKINFTPKTVSLDLMENGQAVWTRARRGFVPPIFDIKDGETKEAAVRRYEDPGAGFFSSVTFPKFIVRPGKAGETQLNENGFGS